MSRLDDELRNALRREEPPAGFAERVTARVNAAPPSRSWMRWAGIAAAIVLLAGGFEVERERRVRAQGEFARDQVMLALRITGSKLQTVKERIDAIDSVRH